MPTTTPAKARPTSMPLTPAAARAGAAAGRAGAAAGAGAATAAAGFAGAAAAAGAAGAAAAGAAGAAAAGAAGAPAGAGILIEGPPAGLGGRVMRTVCFFWAESAAAALGASGAGAGAGAGGTGLVGSDIGEMCHATLERRLCRVKRIGVDDQGSFATVNLGPPGKDKRPIPGKSESAAEIASFGAALTPVERRNCGRRACWNPMRPHF